MEFIRAEFKSEGYTLLTNEYVNNKTKLGYTCPNGHTYVISWNKWKYGRRCPYCNPKGRVRNRDINDIRKLMLDEGYTLLSTKYVDLSSKLDYICPKGHKYSTSLDNWLYNGNRCGVCNGNTKISTDTVRESLRLEGFTLLSKYKSAHNKFKYKCNVGHIGFISWAHWNDGTRCPVCSNKVKKSLDFVKDVMYDEGYTLLTEKYINGKQKLKCICTKGHEYEVTWNNWQQGNRCPVCSVTGTSVQEVSLIDFIKSFRNNVVTHDRSLISPYEVDILLPDDKIAIEYCGLYWHSEKFKKDSEYHLSKLTKCESAGYRLITIFEDEWVHKTDIVKLILKSVLNTNKLPEFSSISSNHVAKITNEVGCSFCDAYHLKGSCVDSIVSIGSFCNSNLAAVMTFSEVNKNSRVWEIDRCCCNAVCDSVDLYSTMLRYFNNNYNCKELITYQDRRWSIGSVYRDVGFKLIGRLKPTCWCFSSNSKRVSRSSLNRSVDGFSPKYNKIWDCGNLKLSKKIGGV